MPKAAKQLYEGYSGDSRIQILQQGCQRYLTIDGIEQSRIDRRRPADILSAHCDGMLASLLFMPRPRRVLLAGTGGGELARFLDHHDATIQGHAIEKDALIASLARRFFDFPENNWKLDVVDLRACPLRQYDLICLDIAEAERSPSWLLQTRNLQRLHQALGREGVLAINFLPADEAHFIDGFRRLLRLFTRQAYCLGSDQHRNIILLGIKSPTVHLSQDRTAARLATLRQRWGMDFSRHLARLQRDNPHFQGLPG